MQRLPSYPRFFASLKKILFCPVVCFYTHTHTKSSVQISPNTYLQQVLLKYSCNTLTENSGHICGLCLRHHLPECSTISQNAHSPSDRMSYSVQPACLQHLLHAQHHNQINRALSQISSLGHASLNLSFPISASQPFHNRDSYWSVALIPRTPSAQDPDEDHSYLMKEISLHSLHISTYTLFPPDASKAFCCCLGEEMYS